MFKGGYMGRLLRINLNTRSYSVEGIDPEENRLFLGGRGVGALWYWREIGPEVEPLGAENKIGFLVGLSGGWKVFLASMTVLLTVLGAVLPWLLVFGVPAAALWWLARRRRRNRPAVPALVAPAGTPPPPGVSAPPPVPGARSAP